jgi:hypothetical protein
MLARTLINYSKSVMSHARDITVIHTIDKRIFFDIPLYFEKGMLVETVRVEDGRLIVIAKPSIPTA